MKSIIGWLESFGIIKSKGVKRTLASVLLIIAQLPIPAIDPFREMLLQVATILGAAGMANMVVTR